MNNAMVVFLDYARKARDLGLEVKKKAKQEREAQEAAQVRDAELGQERRYSEKREAPF